MTPGQTHQHPPAGMAPLDQVSEVNHLGYTELGRHRHLVVSERLRARRRELDLTQKEVVVRLRRLGVDTTNKALSSLEHGAGLDVCKLPEIARALECTLTYVVGLTTNPLRWEPDGITWPHPSDDAVDEVSTTPPDAAGDGDAHRVANQQPAGPPILGPLAGSRRVSS